MAARTEISCPQCGKLLGEIQWMFRKPSGPIAYSCPDCSFVADVSDMTVEWELLTPAEKVLRVIATALVSAGSGFGLALLAATLGWLFLHNLGFIGGESLPITSPYFLSIVGVVGLVICLVQFRWMMLADVPGSRRRLEDPKYRRLLVRLNLMEDT